MAIGEFPRCTRCGSRMSTWAKPLCADCLLGRIKGVRTEHETRKDTHE